MVVRGLCDRKPGCYHTHAKKNTNTRTRVNENKISWRSVREGIHHQYREGLGGGVEPFSRSQMSGPPLRKLAPRAPSQAQDETRGSKRKGLGASHWGGMDSGFASGMDNYFLEFLSGKMDREFLYKHSTLFANPTKPPTDQ